MADYDYADDNSAGGRSSNDQRSEAESLLSHYSNTTFYESDEDKHPVAGELDPGTVAGAGAVEKKAKNWKYTGYRSEGSVHIFGEWTCRSEAFRMLVIGPDISYSVATLVLIVVPSILAYLYILKNTVELVIYSILLTLCLGSFIGVFFADPGLLRKYNHARSAKWTYCDYCESFRPPGCVHCSTCRVCVADYDHHCPWTGKCVGNGNMYWFKGFTISLTWLIISYFIFLIWRLL